ncbi:MAG: hypothetical protein WCT85_04320 [Parachlamydiales bacterium]|jgi:hypothetical protein
MSTIPEYRLECSRSKDGNTITEFSLNNQPISVNSTLVGQINAIFRKKITDDDHHILIEEGNVTSKGLFYNTHLTLDPQVLQDIFSKCLDIEKSIEAEKLLASSQESKPEILRKVTSNSINALEKKFNTDPKLTKLLLAGMVFGFLATVVGLGSLLTQLNVLNSDMGIVGISKEISIGLMASGAVLTTVPLLITAASSKDVKTLEGFKAKAKEYFEDIKLTRNRWLLDGNLNDLTGGLLFLILALQLLYPYSSFLNSSAMTTTIGCLSYPTGILFISSGLMQLTEAISSLKNAEKIKDVSEEIKQWLNIATAGLVAVVGVLITFGMINSLWTIALSASFGLTGIIVAGKWGLLSSYNKLKEINNVEYNNEQSIKNYLDSILNLSEKEIKEISDKINSMTQEDISKWINGNLKIWENAQQKTKWSEIEDKLKNITTESEEKDLLEEVKKLIINEEMKKAIESKQENFRAMVSEETFTETINFIKGPSANENIDSKMLFAKIKKEATTKFRAEFAKFFIVYLTFFAFPLFKVLNIISKLVYDSAMATASFASVGVNAFPRFRNIAPAVIKDSLDINEEEVFYKNIQTRVSLIKENNSPSFSSQPSMA